MVIEMSERSLKVHVLRFRKADLDRAPEDEKLFYLMSGSLANDIQMLMKTVAVIEASMADHERNVASQADGSYILLFLRLLAGRLYEGHNLIKGSSRMLRESYEPLFEEKTRDGAEKLRKYFANKNCFIKNVRQKLAFHSDSSVALAAYNRIPESSDIGDYLTEAWGNSMHFTPEIMHYEALGHLADDVDHEKGTARLWTETKTLATYFGQYIGDYAITFARKYVPEALEKMIDDTEEVPAVPFEQMRLNFFSHLPRRAPDTSTQRSGVTQANQPHPE